MNTDKGKLLSIGEISKLTGAGIKALRYYERINLLKPAYVDPGSGYRYYLFNQTYLVGLIQFAVELDIPLKKLSEFIDEDGSLDLNAFGVYGKKVTEKKITALQKGLKFIELFGQKIASELKYPFGQIYEKDYPEKIFYTIPCQNNIADLYRYEVAKLLLNLPFYEDYEETPDMMPEYGFLYESTPEGIKRCIFIETPENKIYENCKRIPAGRYYCRQSKSSRIEHSAEIFKDRLCGGSSFIAIETEIFSDKLNINNPTNELRVILAQAVTPDFK